MIALFSEPIQAEFRKTWGAGWERCLWLGVSSDEEGTSFALIVEVDGTLRWVEGIVDNIRTMWRYDADLQDWEDTGEPTPPLNETGPPDPGRGTAEDPNEGPG